jgi:steroid delta-isomerase
MTSNTADTHTAITWEASEAAHPARDASRRSMSAVVRGEKDEWVGLFATDAVVEDPVGPSGFDPEGKGHHGRDGIAAFWDMAIANVERFEFAIRDSFAAGNEVANIGTISAFLPGDMRVDTDGVFVYRVGEDGLIKSMRAFWEVERAMATARSTKD